MNPELAFRVAKELQLSRKSVDAVLSLLEEDATIPFIARYRKEATGSLDEEVILSIKERYTRLEELETRKAAILSSLRERDLLTAELEAKINAAVTMTSLEDAYLPYRPKRKTRASDAAAKGLLPLAERILEQKGLIPEEIAGRFVSEEKGVSSADEALKGARDIIAERISENGEARSRTRLLFGRKGRIKSAVSRGKEEEGTNFRDYFNWEEPAAPAPSHRILAMFRGEKEKFLSLSILPPEEEALRILKKLFVTGGSADSRIVEESVIDGYRRLLAPSMETELRNALKKKADREAISVFARNVREMLLAPPLGPKNILAVDPGFRTGCKFVCLDRQGKLLHHGVIFPHPPKRDEDGSAAIIRAAVEKYQIEAAAIGNGTAGRETERFFKKIGLPSSVIITMVNESGASVYSASEIARREFPDHDITVRGAVSIGRRLLDPLAELVKIDPKSIGVGQYQHDVDQKELKNALETVVESCVHAVGVDLNTASPELLSFVSGITAGMASQIVNYRETNGPFPTRRELLKVPRLGPKTFEQSAGFLRVTGGPEPLDASAVHPERYTLVEKMASDLDCSVEELLKNAEKRKEIDTSRYVSGDVGLPTLADIMKELEKPGRDPRDTFEVFSFREGVEKIEDLASGMELDGVVTNTTSFGVFVDIGVHQDGLVHKKHLPSKTPAELHPGQKIRVSVLEVDLERKRIALSMKNKGKGKKS
ncbi:MAG: Tex family protein [Synergistaceae bacterium]|nr:Tex family protein [Synergistaceae bacterium]